MADDIQKDDTKRDTAFPVYTIDEALKVATAVNELGGARTAVAKSMIAKHMKYAQSGPSFFQRLSAAKSFGMIRGWGDYGLTDSAKRFFYPTSDIEKKNAGMEFLRTPVPFARIISRFEGSKLPPNEMIGNIMHNEAGVPPSWKDRAASIFLRSANFIGAIDASGVLKTQVTAESQLRDAVVEIQKHPLDPPAPVIKEYPPLRVQRPDVRVWEIKDGDNVLRIETPKQLSYELWQLLDNYVQYLKPKGDLV
jgi:hypothetical protein